MFELTLEMYISKKMNNNYDKEFKLNIRLTINGIGYTPVLLENQIKQQNQKYGFNAFKLRRKRNK